ncbi:diacylglycerol kinase iota-like isoform X15 [Bolinopsis microptera]|uniref:diacylglycerol kinase iota-like isoform X15 n=1 Tax=Bolinopsis microptera TaxID=2820187 RepID=UPI00307A0BBD
MFYARKRKSKRSYTPSHSNLARCYRLYMRYGVHCGMKSRSTRAQSAPTESAIRVHLSSLPFSFRRGSSGYHGLRTTSSDWSENASNGTHYWYEYEGSAMCNLTTPDKDCGSVGYRRNKVKCAACRMVLHEDCQENLSVKCRSTFRDANFKKESWTHHHWVLQRKTHTPKCRECNKSLPKGASWGGGKNSKAFIAVTCSWCKDSYHPSCFKLSLIEDHCTLGDFEQIIIPPYWIVFGSKARSGGSRKGIGRRKISYSTRPSSSTKRSSRSKRLSEHEKEDSKRPFHIKVPSSVPHSKTPLLVFVNPKSGGNQGAYLIQAFQWYLNPRQVFDISEGGPGLALSLYQNIVNLRILVCGGDGTVGWVLSEIDKLNFIHSPPVGILPLGTGNDLARVLNWGPGYAGDPVEKILYHVTDGSIQSLDRWEIDVEELEEEGDSSNSNKADETDTDIPVKDLPINIYNNYFSIGLDAYIQYQFHTGREAKPEKFNSRAYNKFVYFKGGFVDTFEQKYKDVSKFIELWCDGKDYTEKIREKKIHVILFLNIKSYGAGTNPWGSHSAGSRVQAMDDGFMEVVGLFGAAQMAALQVGDTGFRITQCKKATVITRKAVHCQVDGEPLYLAPSCLRISRRNQSLMIMKTKSIRPHPNPDIGSSELVSEISQTAFYSEIAQTVKIAIHKVSYTDFHKHYGNIEKLLEIALPLTMVVTRENLALDSIRPTVEKCVRDEEDVTNLPGAVSENWVFLHSANDRLYPISVDMESKLPVAEMITTGIFVLDVGIKGTPKTFRDREADRRDLFAAIEASDIEKVNALRSRSGIDSSYEYEGLTMLHFAAQRLQVQVVEYLLLQQLSLEDLNRTSSLNGNSALHFAAEAESLEICKLLLDAGSDANLPNSSGLLPCDLTSLLAIRKLLGKIDSDDAASVNDVDPGTPV